VPHSRYLKQVVIKIDAIHDPIWSIDDLAKPWVSIFWNNARCFRVLLQSINPLHQFISERFCPQRIIARDEANNVAEVVA
jgi:hypothetical protein